MGLSAPRPPPRRGGSSSASAGVEGLERVGGLAKLVTHLSADHQAAALKWCEDNDADTVEGICLAEMDDAFVASMSLKAGGVNEVMVRKRLAAICQAFE